MLLERYSIQPHVLKRVHCKKGWAYAGIVTNLHFVLNTPKNPYLNQATPKNTCQNFPTQKKSQSQNFKRQKSLRSSLSLEIWSTSPPGHVAA